MAGGLSLGDRAMLIALFPIIVLRLLFNFAFSPIKTLHWRQRLALAVVQARRRTIPPGLRLRNLRLSPTGVGIRDYCIKNDIPLKVVTLDHSPADRGVGPPPTLHFVTPRSARSAGPTLLYFHGGGYIYPMRAAGHVPFALSCGAASGAREVVFLEYSLAPEHKYPVQLVQAVASLRYLLETVKLDPDDIIVAGDSAGGNMVGSLLTHLAKPSPYADPIDLSGGQLRAALFACPWTLMNVHQASFETNHGRDYLDRSQAISFKEAWEPKEGEVWVDIGGAEDAKEVWGRVFGGDSGGLVKRAMVVVGGAEVLLDGCRAFAQLIGAETVVGGRETDWSVVDGRQLVFVECGDEIHVQAAVDCAVGFEGGAMTCAILRWLEHF